MNSTLRQLFLWIVCGGWDLNPRIPKEQGSRNLNVIHSKHRTRFGRDLRR